MIKCGLIGFISKIYWCCCQNESTSYRRAGTLTSTCVPITQNLN